eukprot:COSAG03_NODE_9791_length_693_cov_0.998316_1_plen_131_part_10
MGEPNEGLARPQETGRGSRLEVGGTRKKDVGLSLGSWAKTSGDVVRRSVVISPSPHPSPSLPPQNPSAYPSSRPILIGILLLLILTIYFAILYYIYDIILLNYLVDRQAGRIARHSRFSRNTVFLRGSRFS